MANKPIPKTEIAIDRDSRADRLAVITTASNDATGWLMQDAQKYGYLRPFGDRINKFWLTIDLNWDYDEVCNWIESGGVEG